MIPPAHKARKPKQSVFLDVTVFLDIHLWISFAQAPGSYCFGYDPIRVTPDKEKRFNKFKNGLKTSGEE
ncbi:hypothetical protein TNCV_2849931 [Trichonephila clavipes]|nr:hypothetical protein TNCV_2849931 [Trichonephila clavipes]